MRLPENRRSSGLPKRFPIGAKYVVEGRGGKDGNLRVVSRYVILPGGRRINLPADFGPPKPSCATARRNRGQCRTQAQPKTRAAKARSAARTSRKKMVAGGGTARQGRR